MFITERLRAETGQWHRVTDRYMLARGIERMGVCGACGHELVNHYGVQSIDGRLIWVGIECLHTLTDNCDDALDVQAGTRFSDSGREYIVPTAEWLERLARDYWFDAFCSDIARSARSFGQLTVKQFDAANAAMERIDARTRESDQEIESLLAGETLVREKFACKCIARLLEMRGVESVVSNRDGVWSVRVK